MFGLVFGLALSLFVLAAVLLLIGVTLLALAPLMASRVAATTSRPKLARRASGPDRMRALIASQRTERLRRASLSGTLARSGVALSAAAIVSVIAGAIAWLAGY